MTIATATQLALDLPAPSSAPTTTTRPLSIRDALWTLDATTGRRHARPLVVRDLPGTWAARQWWHCGTCDGVMLVRWEDRDNPLAHGYCTGLAEGRVRLLVVVHEEGKQP